jgi:16S rRNA (cytosine967-C5)-methyltransferase
VGLEALTSPSRRSIPDARPEARVVALEALDAVLRRRIAFDALAEGNPDWAALAPRDRAFAFNLVATALRRLGQINALLAAFLHRPLPERDHWARTLLRLGICQLVFLKTPPHAAVDTTVDLARRYRQGRHLALINALLRRVAREGAEKVSAQDAARLNTPDWLWRSWTAAYGPDTCRRIAEAHLDEPPLDLTARADPIATARRVGADVLPTGSLRLRTREAPLVALPGFATGDWWVQDAAAALPAMLLGEIRGRRVIDLCAAPGGKTAQLAAGGALVTAVDRAPERVARLRDNMARLCLPAEIVTANALEWRPDAPADAVLLDAPCSATGTIRRHPDIAWIKRPDDVEALAAAQRRLLAAAAEMVRPGGILVYCVCSLQPEEGPDHAAWVARCNGPLQLQPDPLTPDAVANDGAEGSGGRVPGRLPAAAVADGQLRIFPFFLSELGGMDGFYAIRMRRT